MFIKSCSADECSLLDSLRGSPEKTSPPKKQTIESPQKNVADLAKSNSIKPMNTLGSFYEKTRKTIFGNMGKLSATNLLKSRKTLE